MNELPNTGLFWLAMLSFQQMNCNYNCYNPYNQSYQSQMQCSQQEIERLRNQSLCNSFNAFQQEQFQGMVNSIHPIQFSEHTGNEKLEEYDLDLIQAYFEPVLLEIEKKCRDSIKRIERAFKLY